MEEFLSTLKKEIEGRGQSKKVSKQITSHFSRMSLLYKFLRDEKGVEKIDEKFFDSENCEEWIAEYLAELSQSSLAAGTKNKYCFALKKFFSFCAEKFHPICSNEARRKRAEYMTSIAKVSKDFVIEEEEEGLKKKAKRKGEFFVNSSPSFPKIKRFTFLLYRHKNFFSFFVRARRTMGGRLRRS